MQLYTLSDGVRAHVRALQDAGAFPWFFGPDFKMAFFRPLRRSWPWTTNLGLVACRLPVAGRLIVITISGIHGSLFWNAARHIVIAGALGMIGLAAHVHWRGAG